MGYIFREALRKNWIFYDILQKGGWVANSEHDFFSIKNYAIIIPYQGDFFAIIFQLSFFHNKSIWFSFFLTLSWRNKGKGHTTWQKVIWLIQSSKYKSKVLVTKPHHLTLKCWNTPETKMDNSILIPVKSSYIFW